MPGRPPKLLKFHKAEGTYRKDRHAKRESELSITPGPIGDPPEFISSDPVALAEWNRCVEDPEYKQVLSSAFYSILCEYCHLHSRMFADAKARGAKRKRMTAQDRTTLNILRVNLGRTPAAQAKVRVPKAEKPANKWAEQA